MKEKPKEQYVILELRGTGDYCVARGYYDWVVTYDSFYEALHDCHKGDRIIKYSEYLKNKELYH